MVTHSPLSTEYVRNLLTVHEVAEVTCKISESLPSSYILKEFSIIVRNRSPSMLSNLLN